jgi:hypothetical protein
MPTLSPPPTVTRIELTNGGDAPKRARASAGGEGGPWPLQTAAYLADKPGREAASKPWRWEGTT